MYQITVYGKPIGQPMEQTDAEGMLERMKYVLLGLEMRRVSGQ